MSVFSAAAFFVGFREALEAALIVGICLSATERTGNRRLNK